MGITDWFKLDKDEEDEIKLFSGPSGKQKTTKPEAKKTASAKKKSESRSAGKEEEQTYAIKCRAIVEMVGAPKEYIEKTLKDYIAVMKKTKGLKILKTSTSPTEPKSSMFALFAEIDMEVKDVEALVGFCFDYMPSSIEVYEPNQLVFNAFEINNFFTDLQGKLHKLDMMVKDLRAQNTLLEKNAGLLLRNNILITLKDKSKDLNTLAKNNGIPPAQLEPFLKKLIGEHWIKKVGDEYCLVKPL